MDRQRQKRSAWRPWLYLGGYAVLVGAITCLTAGKWYGQGIVILGIVSLALSALIFIFRRDA